jgi:hypothetical protein
MRACRALARQPKRIAHECFRVERDGEAFYAKSVSKIQQIEAELEKLSAAELRQIREWLDDFLEDQLQFTDEFEAQVAQSEKEMKASLRPRVRRPDSA